MGQWIKTYISLELSLGFEIGVAKVTSVVLLDHQSSNHFSYKFLVTDFVLLHQNSILATDSYKDLSSKLKVTLHKSVEDLPHKNGS